MFAKKARSQSNVSLPFCDFLYHNLIGSLKYLFITNTMRKEGEIMRYRQIFLAVSAMLIAWLMACGCSGGNADGQGAYGEGGGVLTGKDLYKKTGRFW